MKRIAILTSGGDAPGMNACIRAALRASIATGVRLYGVRHGYVGLVNGDIELMDRRAVAGIIHQGGTVLGTARCQEFFEAEGRARAAANLRRAGIDGLIVVGGDGSFKGGNALMQEHGIQVMGVPGTIDNDISGTDFTIGFDTAVNTALEAIDRLRDTAQSHERLFFVEVMGRHTGFIALECAIAGGAEYVVMPEVPVTAREISLHLSEGFERGKRSAIVVVAEGDRPGHVFDLAGAVREIIGIDSRVCVLGHVQRGGMPTARDRILASKMGVLAVQCLVDDDEENGMVVGEVGGSMLYTPLAESVVKRREISANLESLAQILVE